MPPKPVPHEIPRHQPLQKPLWEQVRGHPELPLALESLKGTNPQTFMRGFNTLLRIATRDKEVSQNPHLRGFLTEILLSFKNHERIAQKKNPGILRQFLEKKFAEIEKDPHAQHVIEFELEQKKQKVRSGRKK
ncbi:MAG: hypothetical protein HY917_04530 [Candidatus Diapherotrites archaeon]|nr:hypothetical protein [Candidatus Diapherotrites archaeon]